MGTLGFTAGLLVAGFLAIYCAILVIEAVERRSARDRFASGADRIWYFVRIAAVIVGAAWALRLALASQ
jgi:hypothetical protein